MSSPVDNDLEADLVNFLTGAEDGISFIKNVPHIEKLKITYYDSRKGR